MTTMYRYRYLLSNFTGAPGYINFYTDATVLDTDAMNAFWDSIYALFPTGLTITQPTTYDAMTVEDGEIIGGGAVLAQPTLVSPAADGPYAGMAGGLIDWTCAPARVASRTVRGRTFLVPFTAAAYNDRGQLAPSTVTSIQGAANTLLGLVAPHLVIWSRPYAGRGEVLRPPKPPLPAKPARVGTIWPITGALVTPVQATLRSRRT